MLIALQEIQNRIKAAHIEAEWIVAGIEERFKSILRARALQREYPTMMSAASALTDPKLELFPDEIEKHLQLMAEERLEDSSRATDAEDMVLAANFMMKLGTRRWASREDSLNS